MALEAALGPGGRTIGRIGVIRWLNQKPLDVTIFILILIGLSGYVMLRLMQAFKDTNDKGNSWKGLIKRAGYLISAVIYLFFMIAGSYILFPQAEVWQEDEVNYVSYVLQLPAGNLGVALVGVVSSAYGIMEIFRAVKGSFQHHLKLERKKSFWRKMLLTTGTIGYFARGIMLALVGFFVVKAALTAYEKQTSFTSHAYQFLASSFGMMIMGVVAAGLSFYGLFMFIKAKYYKISA